MQLDPRVAQILRDFRCVGFSSPEQWEPRASAVFVPNFPGERLAVVEIDALRCGTTITACLAAGCRAVAVFRKTTENAAPIPLEQIQALKADLDCEAVLYGGEKHGQPIAGGVIGNSPREAAQQAMKLRDALLFFYSTNFGGLFEKSLPYVRSFHAQGGQADVYIATLHNTAAVARRIRSGRYHRVVVAGGGFYGAASQEDDLAAGKLLMALDYPFLSLDDGARGMYAGAWLFRRAGQPLDWLENNAIGKALQVFGVAGDIAACVRGETFSSGFYQRLASTVPKLLIRPDIPVFQACVSLRINPAIADSGYLAPVETTAVAA